MIFDHFLERKDMKTKCSPSGVSEQMAALFKGIPVTHEYPEIRYLGGQGGEVQEQSVQPSLAKTKFKLPLRAGLEVQDIARTPVPPLREEQFHSWQG
jgi:hypothetical protein